LEPGAAGPAARRAAIAAKLSFLSIKREEWGMQETYLGFVGFASSAVSFLTSLTFGSALADEVTGLLITGFFDGAALSADDSSSDVSSRVVDLVFVDF
jgi:hypothetical protein